MRLAPTFSLYIVRQFLAAFAAVLLLIMGLILTFDLIELIRRAGGHEGVSFWALLTMALFKLPQMTHTIMPFAVMIGSMVAFWRLTRTHELVVARAAGVSAWQFLAPVVVAALAIGIIETTAFNPLASALFVRFQHLEDKVLRQRAADQLDVSDVGLWLREGIDSADGGKAGEQPGGQLVVHSEGVHQQGLELDMRDVHIFVYDREDHFAQRLSAATAKLVPGFFLLDDVWIMRPGESSEHIDKLKLPTKLTLKRVNDNFAAPETLSFWQLPSFISFFEKAGFAAPHHRMYFQSLLSSPLLYCGMVLVAALFSLNPNMRSGGLAMRIAGGVATGFVVYFFSRIVYAFGLSQTVPQVLAAWAPALMTSLAGLGVLFHLEDG